MGLFRVPPTPHLCGFGQVTEISGHQLISSSGEECGGSCPLQGGAGDQFEKAFHSIPGIQSQEVGFISEALRGGLFKVEMFQMYGIIAVFWALKKIF